MRRSHGMEYVARLLGQNSEDANLVDDAQIPNLLSGFRSDI
jgi:hypothetical protein